MCRPPLNIDVAKNYQHELRTLLKGGCNRSEWVLRALALLQLAEDASAPQIGKVIHLTPQAIRRLGHRYQRAGLYSLQTIAMIRRFWLASSTSAAPGRCFS